MRNHHRKLPRIRTSLSCNAPPLDRKTFGGKVVQLQPRALRSFETVYARITERTGHHGLWIASSYRSCKEQEAACNNICGDGCSGCPGLCAPCGHSYHQIGLAVDCGAVHPRNVEVVRRAFYAENWHNFSSDDSLKATGGDPNHMSYRVKG